MQLTEIRKFTTLLLFTVIALGINAQAQPFQRLFTGLDRATINQGCESTKDGGFYLINFYSENDQSAFGLNISKHDPKGNLNWSNDYEVRNTLFYLDFRRMDIIRAEGDTIIICGNIVDPIDGLGNGAYILKIEPNEGEVEASIQINNSAGINGVNSWVRLLDGYNSDFYYLDTHVDGAGISFVTIARMDENLNGMLTTSFRTVDDDGNAGLTIPFDLQGRADSSLVVAFAGSADTSLTDIGIAVFDTSLNAQFAYQYTLENIPGAGQQVFGMSTTPDTGTVVLTTFTDPVLMEPSSLLFKLDSLGNVEWAKNIGAISEFALSFINDVHYNQFGEIVVTGKSIDFTTFRASDFALFFDVDGNVVRQKLFESDNSFFLDLSTGLILLSGNVNDANDGHTYYSTTGLNADVGGILTPLVLKMDNEGSAICEDTIATEFITDVILSRDTVALITGDVSSRDTLVTGIEEFTGYQVPIVQLQDTVYCPQDPIMHTLNATTVDAVSYLWSTGDTTPTILVTEEGEFIVTVTFEDRVCFALCDTAMVSKREFPEANITPDLSVPCEVSLFATSSTDIVLAVWNTGDTINKLTVTEPGQYTVTITDSCENTSESTITIGEGNFNSQPSIIASPQNACPGDDVMLTIDNNIPVDTYTWNTGETTESITVNENGTYSVTIMDICGNEVTTSIDFEYSIADFTLAIIPNQSRLCQEGEYSLLVTPENSGVLVESILWSTGENTQQINVANAGTYSVTVTNNCGNTSAQEISLAEEAFDISFTANITQGTIDPDDCSVALSANHNSVYSDISYLWNTGETTEEISVEGEGLYSVTISDGCSSEADSIEVSLEGIAFPNIFFPDSNIETNKTFRPFIGCPQFFSGDNYELKVYNRWGNLVFETQEVTQGWNGRVDGDQAPSAVYMYYATWTSESGEESTSGNVTLSR
ncbi:MAG: hypothetical protein HKN09_06535 [Saprospiraceae bacterium]|nr:hypothetical protein [Saprospiraceae bacterium]